MAEVESVGQVLTWGEMLEDTLLGELMTVQLVDPMAELEEGEVIIGEMTEYEKRLYSLSASYRKFAGMLEVKCKWDSKSRGEMQANQVVAGTAESAGRAIMRLLWSEIRKRLPVDSGGIGVREGFKIVSFESEKEPSAKHKLVALLEHLQRTAE